MIGYVMLGAKDIGRAREFYDPLMSFLGAMPKEANACNDRVTYMPANGFPLLSLTIPYDGNPAVAGNGVMVAFPVASRKMVEDAHALALSLGAKDEGAPGVRSDNINSFYSCYVRDEVGNKLCICYFDRP